MKLLLMVSYILLLAAPVVAANSERHFGGVGIDGIPLPDGQIRVRQLVGGGPAQLAGVRINDIITHIDGKATLGSDFQTMVQKRLRGIAGTPVVLKIKRAGEEKPVTFTLIRRQLAMPPPKER
jgi:C-terminal processing protease CtpA/Prc